MNKQAIILVIVISLAVGFGGGWYFGSRDTAREYQVKMESIRAKLPDVGSVRRVEELKAFNANVVSVEGNVIKITMPPSPDPFEEWPTEREVVVGEKTTLLRRIVKDPKVYAEEQAAFAQNPVGEPPQPYKDEPIEVDELAPGTTLGIETARDVKFEKRFEAVVIRAL